MPTRAYVETSETATVIRRFLDAVDAGALDQADAASARRVATLTRRLELVLAVLSEIAEDEACHPAHATREVV